MLDRLLQFLRREKNTISGLSFGKKMGYLWDYYRYWVLLCVGLILVGFFGIQGMLYKNQPVVISGMFLNVGTVPQGYDYLSDGYIQWLDDSVSRADVIEYIRVEYTQGEQTGDGTGSISSIDALVAARSIDYIILDETALRYFGPLELCKDVDRYLTDTQMELLDDKLVKCYGLDRKQEYLAAIDISDSDFAEKFGLTHKPAYLIILVNSPRSEEQIHDFIEYFFAAA